MRKKPSEQRLLAGNCLLNIRKGMGASRKELADLIGMSPSTAGLYVDALISAGYVRETGLVQGLMGRPKRRLEVCPEAGMFLGLEWTADHADGVLVDFEGRLVDWRRKRLAGTSAKAVMSEICAMACAMREGVERRLLGVGLGAPGVVNVETGTAGDYHFIEDWNRVPVRDEVHARVGAPVTVINNMRAIALAERWHGGGMELQDFVVVGARRGFGVAIVHGGSLLTGANHAAGEVGNWLWVGSEGDGELHHDLSATAIWRRLSGKRVGTPPPDALAEALQVAMGSNPEVAGQVVDELAQVIGKLQLLLDSEAFFIHGPISDLGAGFWQRVVARAIQRMPRLAARPPKVICTRLGPQAGALGAACVAMESWVPDL
jgi:predicted NBD/HSP70 family sugar kinase